MIRNRQDYLEYLEEDRKALGITGLEIVARLTNVTYCFQRYLRHAEYLYNCKKSIFGRIAFFIVYIRFKQLSLKCGFTIPLNVCGKGLNIPHYGTIIINSGAKIGNYCRIHADVNIGTAAGTSEDAPNIGNNVFIGPGAKLFGKITIGDGIAVGANSVVNKSFTEPGVTIAGNPAKVVSCKGSKDRLYKPDYI